MKFDFTSIMDRHGMDAIAVDGLGQGFAPAAPKPGFDVIPMWVADMNFPTAPSIPEAIIRRASHPAYGYFSPTPEYYDAIIRWQKERNGVEGVQPEHIGYENGVLGGVISALTAFAAPGDGVLLHSPTYIGFTGCITNNGYKIVHSPLYLDEQGVWRMDFEDMDRTLKENHIHVAVFCSPHNPTGRVWERWEIEKAMEVYKANDCLVISDEIWSDLILNGYKHVPTQSVSADARERTVAGARDDQKHRSKQNRHNCDARRSSATGKRPGCGGSYGAYQRKRISAPTHLWVSENHCRTASPRSYPRAL